MSKKTLQQGEDLFDFLRKEAVDRLSSDAFEGVANVFVKVLRVFEIPIPRKGMNWISAVMPEVRLGKRRTVMAFKGRVFTNNYEKYLTVHSAIPEPDEYQDHIYSEQFIDMHPTFLIIKDTGNQKLEVNDICRCTFPSSYAEAGGDSYGFFVDKVGDVESTGLKMRQEKMAKESFEPRNRIFDPPPPPVSFFDKLPLNIVLIGDNMFGVSPTKLGTNSAFATILQKRIRGLYKDLDLLARKKMSAKRIAKKYIIDFGTVAEVEKKIKEENLRIPYKNIHIHNLAVGNVDATYFDPAMTADLYAGKSGKINIRETGGSAQSGAEIIDNIKHFKRPNFEGEDEPPKFFIAGFEGNSSAIPGWAGLLPDSSPALSVMAYGAWGGEDPLKATKKEYAQLQKYAEYVAGENYFEFQIEKTNQFSAMLDHLKNAGMEGGIFVGPLVLAATGKSYVYDGLANTDSEETYPGSYTFTITPTKSKKSRTIREPVFHSGFYYRSGMSEGMRSAAEDHSLKTWTCLPYCVRNPVGFSSSEKDNMEYAMLSGRNMVPKPISPRAGKGTLAVQRKILCGWILNNLLSYTLGLEPASQKPKSKKADSQYGLDHPMNIDKREDAMYQYAFDKDDITTSAQVVRTLAIQKELVKELDRIYQQALKEKGADNASPAADMLQYTNKKVKDINAYLKSNTSGYAKLP